MYSKVFQNSIQFSLGMLFPGVLGLLVGTVKGLITGPVIFFSNMGLHLVFIVSHQTVCAILVLARRQQVWLLFLMKSISGKKPPLGKTSVRS